MPTIGGIAMSAKNKNAQWVVTANDLLLGDVVYLNPQTVWTRHLQEAMLLEQREPAEDLANQLRRQSKSVVGIDVIAMTPASGAISPQTLREKLRQSGPSIDYTKAVTRPNPAAGENANVSLR